MITNTPITAGIMLVIFLCSGFCFLNKKLFLLLILHPYSVVKNQEYWRLFTADFVHNDLSHLLVNEFMLYISCSKLEYYLRTSSRNGACQFLCIYLCSYFTGVVMTTIIHRNDFNFSTAGASGSIMGCLFSFILLRPNFIAYYLPVLGPVKNIYGGLMYILIMILYQRKKENRIANHELHFFSSLGGIASTLLLFPGAIK